MKKVTRCGREFWVGSLKRPNSSDLGLVIYDPKTKAAIGMDYVVLFEASEQTFGNFRKEIVRELVGSADIFSVNEIEYAIDSYCNRARIKITESHRQFLAKRGLPPATTRTPSVRSRRVAHCYSCKKHLDNAFDVECEACGWIICMCGACGCGFNGI